MKEINLDSLDISFFKGIRNLHVDFGKVTTISGDNGLGKTTIADAFSWVLFNKDSIGRTKFRVRTIGENVGDTFVEVSLSVNGEVHNLRKQLIVKQNDYGSEQNEEQSMTSKYFVDGQQYTKKDFDAFIADIISESAFRTITSPTYFFSLNWKEQRNLLASLVDPVGDKTINADHRFDIIEDVLKTQFKNDVEAMQKHLAYQIKEVKQSLDTIPVQLTEMQGMLPEEQDWSKLRLQLGMLNSSLNDNLGKLASLRAGRTDAVADNVRHQIEFCEKRIDNIRTSCRNMFNVAQEKFDNEMREDRNKLAEYKQSLHDIRLKLESLATLISRSNEMINEQNDKQEIIRREWKMRITDAKPCLDDIKETCPVCGQPLPYEKVQETKDQILAKFNESKAEAKKELTTRANETKGMIARATNDIAKYQSEVSLAQGQQKAIEQYISNLEKKINDAFKHSPKTVEERLAENEGYQDAMKRIEELKARLESSSPVDNTEAYSEVEQKINSISSEMSLVSKALAQESVFNKVTARIEELTKRQDELHAQYDSLIQQQDVCLQYQLRAGEILEQKINEHFHYVKFSLFKHLVNGSIEPFCEGYVDGVPYQTNINSAAKLNAGRDVCNAFCNKLQVLAPTFTDNSESVNTLLPINSQDIRFYVSKDPTLKIQCTQTN